VDYEAIMQTLSAAMLSSLLIIGCAPSASAQNGQPTQVTPGAATNMPPSLTGKERLGRKWMDEQRIDNCNVPVGKRGTKPRPSTCAHIPTG
jgi:hypothetical protein